MDAYTRAIDRAFELLPEKMRSDKAKVLLLAIGFQESGFAARRQYGNGPARGFWQFEQAGGVLGVLAHHATASAARALCHELSVPPFAPDVHAALEHDDLLAAGFARLLLWADRNPLPEIGDVDGGWACYLRNWRPGKPHVERWAENYAKALTRLI